MKYQRIRCGACLHPTYVVCPQVTPKGSRLGVYPSYATLIEHPNQGLILFDTGYSEAFLRETESFPERLYRWTTPVRFSPEESLVAQLKRLNIQPEDIKLIILSHFHADHVAALNDFPTAKLLYHSQALAPYIKASRLKQVTSAFLKGLVPADIDERSRFIDIPDFRLPQSGPYTAFAAAYDLFGDQSVVAVDLPGHCSGHIGLMLPDLKVFFVADAIWHEEQVTQSYALGPITQFVTHDVQAYNESVSALRCFKQTHPDFTIFACHIESGLT